MSYILSQVAKIKIPKWNDKIFDLEDFDRLAETHNVRVIENGNKYKGEYFVYNNQAFIILQKGLKVRLKVWIAWHELAHHLLHYPCNHRFSKSTFRRMDREANFVAAIALIPTYLVKTLTLDEIIEEYNYTKELIKIRKEIYEEYKI